MAEIARAKVTAQFKLHLPTAVREALKIGAGDLLVFTIDGGRVRVHSERVKFEKIR